MSELDKLEKWLRENASRFGDEIMVIRDDCDPDDSIVNKHQITVCRNGEYLWDAICHYGSYGYEQGLLEIYGSLVDGGGVKGWLTAEEVIRLIEEKEGKR